jgi:hypothetical protein
VQLSYAGLPNTATVKQYAIASGGVITPYPAETVVGLNCPEGMSGYSGGSSVKTALSYLTNAEGNDFAVGYVGKADYSSSSMVLMTYQGVDSTQANIRAGKYPFWTIFNAYLPKVLKPTVCDTNLVKSVYDSVVAQVQAANKGVNNVDVSSLTIKRSIDGGATSAK